MRRGPRGPAAAALTALVLAACADGLGRRAPEADPATKTVMAEILAALAVALPLSLSAERFTAPENQPALAESLAALRARAKELETHGASQDPGFALGSRSLARDAEEIVRRFDAGRLEEARFLLGTLVDDCVGCHSQLPSPRDSALGASLVETIDAARLTPLERARLEVATRQFERALESYEALLRSPGESPALLDLEGVPRDYLTVAVRVREDPERARETLEAFAKRPDVPSYLATLLAVWIRALGELRGALDARDPLAEAERVLEAGAALGRFPRDRAGLVHEVVASSLLHRYVSAGPSGTPEAARAYFLLGVSELRSGRPVWLSQAEGYLEMAIRTQPGSEWAKRAYVVLEEETLADYSGSGGVHVPPDVRQRLRALQRVAVGD
jgi:tetratricopeptide (TPR) repeat protein